MKRSFAHFLQKLKHDRKGIAVEMAITLLAVSIALSSLVLTTSFLQHTEKKQAEKAMTQSVELEQIGLAFCAATADGQDHEEWKAAFSEYGIVVEDLTMTVYDEDWHAILMTVVLTYEDNKYTVTQWNCN